MKTTLLACSLMITTILPLCAGTSAQEKAFTDKYKAAFEANDAKTLQSFLYTKGADPMVLDFFKSAQTSDAGGKVSKIELVDLSPEEVKKAAAPQDGPSGKICPTLVPTKKLVITSAKKDANGSSSGTSEFMVAEKDGKFVIPAPGPCK